MRTSQCDATMRTSSKALLRLVRQRWAIENEWHWVCDVQLGEHAHRYAERNGVQVLALLRTLGLRLLQTNGFRSIRAGLMAVTHDINRMLGWRAPSAGEGLTRLSVGPAVDVTRGGSGPDCSKTRDLN